MDQGQSNTGTRDETYDLVAVVYHALQGAENCQTYMQDASGKQELRQFFERACDMQRQLADEGKRLLHDQLMNGGGMQAESQSGSAFSQFGSGSSPSDMGSGSGMSSSDMSRSSSMDVGNDPQSQQFGQSASGQGQRHSEMSTGGGGTSSF